MAHKVLIANVTVVVGNHEEIAIGREISQKLLTAAEIEGLVTPQYEGDKCRAHWVVVGKGDLDDEKPKEPPKADEKPKGGKGK